MEVEFSSGRVVKKEKKKRWVCKEEVKNGSLKRSKRVLSNQQGSREGFKSRKKMESTNV